MPRMAVLVSLLVLLLISVLPLSCTVAESFLVREPRAGTAAGATAAPPGGRPMARGAGRVVGVTTDRYSQLFAGSAEAGGATNETPSNRPASKRWAMLGNSLAIALVAAALALAAGIPYAFLVSRTDMPLRGVLGTLYGAPLVLPPLVIGLAWTYIPWFAPPPQSSAPPPHWWDGPLAILRCGGMFALCYFPVVVLFTTRALRRVPAALEDAARLAGGSWAAVRRVTLPLAAPAILASGLFVFLFALEDFALADFLNWVRPVGQQVGVYPYESFIAWGRGDGEAVATALGMPLVVLGAGALLLIHRLVVRSSRTTIAGDWREGGAFGLGRWRWPAAALTALALVVAAGVPLAGLAWKSGTGGVAAFRTVWDEVAGPETLTSELRWTLWYAGWAAVLATPLAFVLAHHAARRGRIWPLVLAFLPLALPPIFLGAGSVRVYGDPAFAVPLGGGATRNPFLDADSPRLGPILILVAKYVPFAVAALWAAFLSVDPRLEEAAASAGARPLDRALRVLVPLTRPAILVAAALVFVFSLREIDTLVLVSSDTLLRKIYSKVHISRDEQVAALCTILVVLQALPFAFLALLLPRGAGAAEARAA